MTLKERHGPTAGYVRRIRRALREDFPGVNFAFLPADMVGQILNFGSPSPIDVQVSGPDVVANSAIAQSLLDQMRRVPGLVDARIQQPLDNPELRVQVDRSRSQDLGITQRDVANNLLIPLSGSFQTQPTFWLDPKLGTSYPIVAQTPQQQLQTLDSLRNVPLAGTRGAQILGAVGDVSRGAGAAIVTHYNTPPTLDLYAGADERALGAIAKDVGRLVEAKGSNLPKGTVIALRGQVQTMSSSYAGLFVGLGFAVVLVYLLIVVNFQSWLDPFIIITALPATMAGIVWMLFITGTPLSVPALTGAIMSVGVATADAILVVSFARDNLARGKDATTAAISAGFGRFRPVLMTALAMIIGMLPMAIGLGEGGEQNAPLGRAVIGGLPLATVATLLFVPAVFAALHAKAGSRALPAGALQPAE